MSIVEPNISKSNGVILLKAEEEHLCLPPWSPGCVLEVKEPVKLAPEADGCLFCRLSVFNVASSTPAAALHCHQATPCRPSWLAFSLHGCASAGHQVVPATALPVMILPWLAIKTAGWGSASNYVCICFYYVDLLTWAMTAPMYQYIT